MGAQYHSLKPVLQRELLVSKPTSLGDAFSLARVTKARIDDHTTIISTMQEDAIESRDILILNSLVGHGSPQWLQLWGALGTGKVHILIDNGSTHNFVQPGVVKHMKLPLTGNDYTFKDEESLRMKQISLLHMRALLETDEIYGVYELHLFSNEEHTSNTSAAMVEMHPKISQLLTRFETLFQMSLDMLTVGSTMRIPLLYRGEYSQWVERFMNYLEEQTDGEAMINSIKNSDQPLPRVTHVYIAGTTSTEQPPLKDKSMWADQEKRVQ
nr:hypothetical protein [Tanacetum cinerariifolium]